MLPFGGDITKRHSPNSICVGPNEAAATYAQLLQLNQEQSDISLVDSNSQDKTSGNDITGPNRRLHSLKKKINGYHCDLLLTGRLKKSTDIYNQNA